MSSGLIAPPNKQGGGTSFSGLDEGLIYWDGSTVSVVDPDDFALTGHTHAEFSTFALASHTHSAADIISGTLDAALLPNSGASANTYAYPSQVIVDAKGRITSITGGSTPSFPGHSHSFSDVSGVAPVGASYVTISAESGLSAETTLATALVSPPPIGGGTPAAGTFDTLRANGVFTFAGVVIKPASNTSPFVNFTQADGSTPILTLDSVNIRVGIRAAAPVANLDVRAGMAGAITVAQIVMSSTNTTPFADQIALKMWNASSTTNNNTNIAFLSANSHVSGGFQFQNTSHTSGYGRFQFLTREADGFLQRLQVSNIGLEIAAAAAYYIGDALTNGSWRFIISGADLVIEKRESGSWVTKSTIAA